MRIVGGTVIPPGVPDGWLHDTYPGLSKPLPLAKDSHIWEHGYLRVYGEAAVAKFARKHSASRKPLQRFFDIAREADWPHFLSVKKSFAAADYAPSTGTLIFDVGGDKYRLIARADFEEQMLFVLRVLTHEEYIREDF